MAIAQEFTSKVTASVKGKLPSRKQLSKSEISTRASRLRQMGRSYLGINDIKVWGNPKNIASDAKPNSNVTAIVPSQPMPDVCELTDNDINSSSKLGLVVVGYGDPTKGYGAGPTRDLRRATLAVRIAITFKDMDLRKNISGIGIRSDFVKEMAGILAQDFSGKFGELTSVSGMDRKFWLECEINNVFKTGIWPLSVAKGDVTFMLTFGYQSGQRFLPQEIRDTSPLYGRLDHVYAGIGSVFEKAKEWMDCEAASLQKIAERLSTTKHKPDVSEAVTIDNT